jgi:hypothetical protein
VGESLPTYGQGAACRACPPDNIALRHHRCRRSVTLKFTDLARRAFGTRRPVDRQSSANLQTAPITPAAEEARLHVADDAPMASRLSFRAIRTSVEPPWQDRSGRPVAARAHGTGRQCLGKCIERQESELGRQSDR